MSKQKERGVQWIRRGRKGKNKKKKKKTDRGREEERGRKEEKDFPNVPTVES